MLKKLLIVCIALAPLAAVAQDVKIGYINTQEIFASMPELSSIETQLSNKQEEISKMDRPWWMNITRNMKNWKLLQPPHPMRYGWIRKNN